MAHILCLIARGGTPARPAAPKRWRWRRSITMRPRSSLAICHAGRIQQPRPGRLLALEAESVDSMTRLLPPELAEEVSPFITGSLLTAEEKRLLKAADRLSALIKCMDEQRSGNHEFDAALRQQREALEGMHCPEADWFMAHCLPCFTQNLTS